MAIKPILTTCYLDSACKLEVPARPKRSISFSKDSPQVFEYASLQFEDNSKEDSFTPTFSQTSNFSLVVSDLTTEFNRIKNLKPNSADMNHIFAFNENDFDGQGVDSFDNNLKVKKLTKAKPNCSGDQPELDEFFCLTTDKSQGISASCGCIMF